MIGSTLLGLSMIDIYAFDFINWLKDTNIYRWYSELFNKPIVETKTDIKEPSSIMRSIDKNTTRNEERDETDYEILQRLQQLIHKDKDPEIIQEDIENPPFYKNKYFAIIGVIGVATLVSWYYYGDNITPVINSGIEKIKTGYGAIIDYLSSFRSTPPDDPTGSNSSGSATSSKLNIKSKLDRLFKTPDARIIGDAASEIEILDNNQPITSTSKIDKGKGVLTSPSLEDLNNQASESWGEGSSSPSSESSSSTITPSNFTEKQESVTAETISESSIDSNPSKIEESIENRFLLPILVTTWQNMLSENLRNKIQIIENGLNSSEKLTEIRKNFIIKMIGELMAEYDVQTIYLSQNLDKLSQVEIRNTYQCFYHFRKWIQNKISILLPEWQENIKIGNWNDVPKEIFSKINENII